MDGGVTVINDPDGIVTKFFAQATIPEKHTVMRIDSSWQVFLPAGVTQLSIEPVGPGMDIRAGPGQNVRLDLPARVFLLQDACETSVCRDDRRGSNERPRQPVIHDQACVARQALIRSKTIPIVSGSGSVVTRK